MTPDEQLAALKQELQALEAQQAMLDSPVASNPGKQEQLKMLYGELAGLEKEFAQIDQTEPEYSYWDRIKQFGSGLGEGIINSGFGMANSDSYARMTPEVVEALRIQEEDMARQHAQKMLSLDPTGRIIQHAGEFGGSMLANPFPGQGILKGGTTALRTGVNALKGATKATALGGAIGGVSGAAQELGANPLAADIVSSLALPTAIKAPLVAGRTAKNFLTGEYAKRAASNHLMERVGHENVPQALENITQHEQSGFPFGYQGTTAEIANSPGLSQLQRAKQGSLPQLAERHAQDNEALRQALENLAPGHAGIEATQQHLGNLEKGFEATQAKALGPLEKALEPFHARVNAEEAGGTVRNRLVENRDKLKEERKAATQPLADQVKANKTPLSPAHALDYIKEELKTAKGEIRNALQEVRQELAPNAKKAAKPKVMSREDTLAELKRRYPKISHEAVERAYPVEGTAPTPKKPTAAELQGVLDVLNDKIETAKRGGEKKLSLKMSQVKENLLKDLEEIPEEQEFRSAYREKSKPINEIEEHPVLGKAVEKDIYEQNFKINDSQVSSKVINEAFKTPENSRALNKQIGKDAAARNAVEGYVHDQIMRDVVRPDGTVNMKTLETWKNKRPGVFEIYPNLKTKLKNLSNAQYFVTETMRKNKKFQDSHFKGAFESVLGERPERVIPSVLRGLNVPQKIETIIDLTKTDKSGAAFEGFRRGFIDHLHHSTKTAALDTKGNATMSYPKFNNYLYNHKDALKKVFEPDQIKVLDDVNGLLKRRQQVATVGKAVGSDTAANISVLGGLMQYSKENLLKVLPGKGFVKFIAKWGNKALDYRMNKLIDQALLDPSFAKLLLTPMKEKTTAEKALKALTSPYLRLPYGSGSESKKEPSNE